MLFSEDFRISTIIDFIKYFDPISILNVWTRMRQHGFLPLQAPITAQGDKYHGVFLQPCELVNSVQESELSDTLTALGKTRWRGKDLGREELGA